MSRGTPLETAFAERVSSGGILRAGDTVVVALSGGVDSVVLLHLMRFSPGLPAVSLVAAHVDHGMREGSAADAAWVRGLCGAWGIPVEVGRLDPPPAGEAEARAGRYRFLEEVRQARGGTTVLTAHHADDQAETVLFRVVRGAGFRGLQGIRERRAPAVWRPLLAFTRKEILAYARRMHLTWREDPTNSGGFARNVIRARVLPVLEGEVAPGARAALGRLARRARDDEAGWRSLEPSLLARVDARREPGGFSLDRDASLELHPAVRARVLRALARKLGVALHDAGTRLAVEFTRSGGSGSAIPLGGGVVLRRELERLHVGRVDPPPPDLEATIPTPGEGQGRARLGGRVHEVTWSLTPPADEGTLRLTEGEVEFPLTVRAFRPGDRIRMEYGTKKLKKLFLEARVPLGERARSAVLVDSAGRVLWVPGIARAVAGVPAAEGRHLYIFIRNADSD